MIEGYWYSSYMPQFPVPQPQSEPVSQEFLSKLNAVQALSKVEYYRGWSNCRCCGKMNGSTEYEFGEWRWPSGFMHYLTEHNVHPTPEFVAMIEGFAGETGSGQYEGV